MNVMSDTKYIDLNSAISIVDESYSKSLDFRWSTELEIEYNKGWNDACDYIRSKFNDSKLPSTDVAPLIHGRWDDSFGGITPYCTVCKRTHGCLRRKPDFCPNCGAIMDLDERMCVNET